MDLIFFYQALAKRKWMIILLSILAASIAFTFTFLKKRYYTSTAQYSTGLTMQTAALQEDFNVFEIDVKFNNILETFKSPNVIGMLTYRILLHDLASEKPFKTLSEKEKAEIAGLGIDNNLISKIVTNKIDSIRLLSTSNADENKILQILDVYGYDFESFVGALNIRRVARTDYLDIFYSSENPQLSAYVVNAIGPEFLRFFNSLSNIRSNESMESINRQLQTKSKEFDSTFSRLQSTKQTLGTADISAAVTAALGIAQDYETKLANEKANYNLYIAQLASVKGQLQRMPAPTSGSNNNSEVVALRKQISALEAENNSKGGNDQVLLQRIRKLQQDIIEKGRPTNGVKPDEGLRKELQQKEYELEAYISSAKGNISEYESMIRKYQGQAKSLAGKDVDVSREQAKADIASKEFADMKQRYETVQGLRQDAGLNFRQTLFGQSAIKPESSGILITTSLSGVVTFFLISFLILLAAFFDSSVKSPSLYEKQLGIKPSVNLGMLPFKKLDIEQVLDGESGKKNNQITLQYRNAISTLRLRLINERIKSVIFASFENGEGKSTIIEALARSMSKAGKKILIVDANFSENKLTQKFGAKEAFQELAAKGFGKQAVQSQIIETPISGVSIIGCANGNETPIEVLTAAGSGLKDLFDHDQFDFVLIEVASLNFHTDGFELLPYADSIISVCAASSTITNSNAAALHHLSESGNKYLGAVLNKVEKDVLDI